MGEYYDSSSSLNSIAGARAVISASGSTPTAEFDAFAIDYPAGAEDISSGTVLSAFLGPNGSITSGSDNALATSVILINGTLDLAPGTYSFSVGSDDGFELSFGGSVISSFDANRAFNTTTQSVTIEAGDNQDFELLFWENLGFTGLLFEIDGNVVDQSIAAVPLPAGLPLLLAGIGGIALFRRRT
ncbi:MAG: VPLPA-CTERM sorting domain-containing protein [Pseudomonadota bacterium]